MDNSRHVEQSDLTDSSVALDGDTQRDAQKDINSDALSGDLGGSLDDAASGSSQGPEYEAFSRRSQVIRVGGTALFVATLGILGGWPVLVMLAAFAVSILLHEAGHYLVAKQAGMKVTEFFVGFGPKIFSFHKGETEYGLKLIPAGAYVRIIGMSNLEEVDPADEDKTYRAQPFRWRLATVLAGPAMNLILGFLIILCLSMFVQRNDPSTWSVGAVVPGTAAAAAGLEPGDRVLGVDGVAIENYEELVAQVKVSIGGPVTLEIASPDGTIRETSTSLGWSLGEEGAAVLPPLQSGDILLSVDGEPVRSYQDFASIMSEPPTAGASTSALPPEQRNNPFLDDGIVDVEFLRAGGIYAVNLSTGVEMPANGASGFLGVSPQWEKGIIDATDGARESVYITKEMITRSVVGMASFFSPSGVASFFGNAFSGGPASAPVDPTSVGVVRAIALPADAQVGASPSDDRIVSIVGVFRLGAQAADAGIENFLIIWALINVFLALVNLLPLLPFDGGHAVVAIWEKIRGVATGDSLYRVNMARLLPLSYAVIAFFMSISIVAMWLDVVSPVENPF